MRRYFLLYTLYFLLFTLLLAACNTAKFSAGKAAFDRGEYYEAQNILKRVYRKTDPRQERELKGETAWYLGLCDEKLMMPQRAVGDFRNAYRYGKQDSTLFLRLAQNLHMAGRYMEAVAAYDSALITLNPSPLTLNPSPLTLHPSPLTTLALSGREGALNAERWRQDGSRYQVTRVPLVNGRRADFSPAIWGQQDEVLYFTTSRDKAEGDDRSKITGTKYCDIWMMQKDEKGNWKRPESAGSVNTNGDEGTPAFSPDGETMYFTGAGGASSRPSAPQIYESHRSDASWGTGTMLNLGLGDTLSLFAHPAPSPDGAWLYFVSDMDGSIGGLDLWRVSLGKGGMGLPENLGPQVNTLGDEMFPTFDPSGILYFSTNGRAGLGGLDIYSARLDEWNQWHVEHLGAPINSQADDFGMTFMRSTEEEQEGWFASNRGGGKGYDNIYRFLLPSIKVRITGTVRDMDDFPIPEAIVRVVGRNGMNFKSVTRPDGTYEVKIDRSTEYVMMSGKEGYLNRKAQFLSDSTREDADYVVDFYLPSISVPVLVDNIFYDYNEATLRPESYPSLDELIQLLNDNPYCAIELSAHTDRVGSQAYNLDLSQRRAQSVVDYLITQGIDPGRLTPVGYGKAVPKVVSEKQHEQYIFLPYGQTLTEEFVDSLSTEQQAIADQINRRTEFKVISVTWGIE